MPIESTPLGKPEKQHPSSNLLPMKMERNKKDKDVSWPEPSRDVQGICSPLDLSSHLWRGKEDLIFPYARRI